MDFYLPNIGNKPKFIVVDVFFDTYLVADMTDTEIIPGKRINHIFLPGDVGYIYNSITDAVLHFIEEPFSLDPGDWKLHKGKIIIDALSSTIAREYHDSRRFVKAPTQNGIALWEQGKKELYLVRCEITLAMLSSITSDIAQAEGLST